MGVKSQLVKQFAVVQSLALQQILDEMGKAVLSAPNKHHAVYDLSKFGLVNNNEVFHADDRPYGLIQATMARDDPPGPGPGWDLQLDWLA